MRITRRQIRRIIKEELSRALMRENDDDLYCDDDDTCAVPLPGAIDQAGKQKIAMLIDELIKDPNTSEQDAKEMAGWKKDWGDWRDFLPTE